MGYTMKTNLANRSNYGDKRDTSEIKYIVLHYTANDGDTDEANGKYFHNNVVKASAHYFVDDDSVTQSVPDNYVAYSVGGSKWSDCSKTGGGKLYGTAKNANTLNIEMCDTQKDGTIKATEATMANAAALCKTLMAKYNINLDHVIRHFDVNGKHCPAYFMDSDVWNGFKNRLTSATSSNSKLKATALKNLSSKDIVAKVGPLFTADQKKTGVLASVSMAQFILESSYGKSELAQKANNCFGMKSSLSGNTWAGSTWDGSIYEKQTKEYSNGKYITITAKFRKYSNIEDSIADHSAYLLGAKKGSVSRYDGLKGCLDYKKAAQIIKDGGYATSPSYVTNLCNVIEKWGLSKYEYDGDVSASDTGTVISNGKEFPAPPFKVKVLVDDLNYRSSPSMSGTVKGQTKKGIFTIVELSNGWGKLKSGAGWIWLCNSKYCTIL